MRLLACVALFVAAAHAQQIAESPDDMWVQPVEPAPAHKSLWAEWKKEFNKVYEDVETEASRFATFVENLEFIR